MQSSGEPRGLARLLPKVARAPPSLPPPALPPSLSPALPHGRLAMMNNAQRHDHDEGWPPENGHSLQQNGGDGQRW